MNEKRRTMTGPRSCCTNKCTLLTLEGITGAQKSTPANIFLFLLVLHIRTDDDDHMGLCDQSGHAPFFQSLYHTQIHIYAELAEAEVAAFAFNVAYLDWK